MEVERLEKLNASRQQQAQQEYRKALLYLERAQEGHFADRQLLQQAVKYAQQAQRLEHQNPDYGSLLAYFYLLAGELNEAVCQMQAVLRLEPEHEGALQIQAAIQELQSQSPEALRQQRWNSFSALPQPQTAEEYDFLYDELEAFLQTELHLTLSVGLSPLPDASCEEAQAQADFLLLLRSLESLIESKFKCLEAEFELGELRQLCLPLQRMCQRFEHCVGINQRLQELHNTLEMGLELLGTVAGALTRLPEGHSVDLQAPLEHVFDLCDALADELDDLNPELDMAPVIARYEHLVASVERLQDLLDG